MLFRLHKLGDEERQAGCYNTPEHRQAILDTARESVVLLKNKVKKLPLDQKKTKKVLVIGDNADRIHSIGEFSGGETVKYTEGIFVGYRYYDIKKVPVRFPFGYGLSYTEFTYQNLKTEGTYPNVKVSVDVTNTGEVPGKEIVEIYAGKSVEDICCECEIEIE